MNDRIAVGIVGTSWWADLIHLPALASHPRTDLVAICGRNRERAEVMAEKYGIHHVYTDHQEMFDKGALDALVVAVPDDLHYQIAMDALTSGLHVVCEKPLASNADQAREMVQTAQAKGVKHMTFFTLRWIPCFSFMKEMVREGFIGQPYSCLAHFRGSYGHYTGYQWRFDKSRANGILGDLGSHMIDLSRWLVGDIVGLNAHLKSTVKRYDGEGQLIEPANDSALLSVRFENGAHGQIVADAMSHIGKRGVDVRVEIHGEEGMLEARMTFEQATIHGARKDKEDIRMLFNTDYGSGEDWIHPYLILTNQPVGIRHFVDCIVDDRPVSPSFYDGWKTQQVIDAAIESHGSGQWIELSS